MSGEWFLHNSDDFCALLVECSKGALAIPHGCVLYNVYTYMQKQKRRLLVVFEEYMLVCRSQLMQSFYTQVLLLLEHNQLQYTIQRV